MASTSERREPLPQPLRPILIVDDDPDDVDILCHALRRAGVVHPVQTFPSGEKAIEHFTELSGAQQHAGRLPLLCVLDIKMPGFHGTEVLQWIRDHDAFSSVPVMICSSSDDPKDVHSAAQFGAQCYARKYPSPKEFTELVTCAQNFTGDPTKRFVAACNLLVGGAPVNEDRGADKNRPSANAEKKGASH
jgi:CheY-like chemotaxis protein